MSSQPADLGPMELELLRRHPTNIEMNEIPILVDSNFGICKQATSQGTLIYNTISNFFYSLTLLFVAKMYSRGL